MSGMDPKTGLLIALAIVTVLFTAMLLRRVMVAVRGGEAFQWPGPVLIVAGFVIDFLDAIGIGSFATTTAFARTTKTVPDEQIPGTLNVGHTLPTIAQAFIFTKLVPVEPMTLILMIIAAVLGAFFGAGMVSGWSKRKIQLGMAYALLGAAVLLVLRLAGMLPPGSDSLGLHGTKLIIGLVCNFGLGILMTVGIGLYAPCMVLVSLLGMNQDTAFPIMMGSCAFLMPVASAKFIKTGAFNLRATLGLTIGGVVGSIVAGLFFTNLNPNVLRYVVVAVILYTVYGLLTSAKREGAGSLHQS